MSNNITVILPIHEVQDNTEDYLKKSIESVASQIVKPKELLIVTSDNKKLKTLLKKFDFGEIKKITRVVENTTGDFGFQSQLNFGVSECGTEYFTFLEYDDIMSQIWIKNGTEYAESYPDVGIFLPIVFECDENGQFISFTNEIVWGKNVSEEMGYIDNNTLQRLTNFNFDGMIVNKSVYEENGGIKTNMKLTFTYEFLLRMSYLSIPIMVIPKLGYKHTNNRKESLFDHYKNTIDVMESKFWLNKAKKEYFFTEDREITYAVETN
jgi:glycosyltransferase involved in cell wall biosynthesis